MSANHNNNSMTVSDDTESGGDNENESETLMSLDDMSAHLMRMQRHIILTKILQQYNDAKCTYDEGYITQPLFSCITCRDAAGGASASPVSVCADCAAVCHDGHELESLYDKRHARCDCPTRRCDAPCTLYADGGTATVVPTVMAAKFAENVENVYNHNWSKRYCHCDGVYVSGNDVMYQCALCEDWFHARCIGVNDDVSDHDGKTLICRTCCNKANNQILIPYVAAALTHTTNALTPTHANDEKSATSAAQTVASSYDAILDDSLAGWQCAFCLFFNKTSDAVCFGCERKMTAKDDIAIQLASRKRKLAQINESATESSLSNGTSSEVGNKSTSATNDTNGVKVNGIILCRRIRSLPAGISVDTMRDTMVTDEFWQTLCDCHECAAVYEQNGLGWILQDNQTDNTDDEGAEQDENDILVPPRIPNSVAHMNGTDAAERNGDSSVDDADDDDADVDTVIDHYIDSFLSQLPRAAAVSMVERVKRFNQSITDQLTRLRRSQPADANVLVNADIIKTIIEQAKQDSLVNDDDDDGDEIDVAAIKRRRLDE